MNDLNENKKDEELKKMFKSQLKVLFYFNLGYTLLIAIAMIVFHKNITVVIFFAVVIVVMWLYSGVKMLYLYRSLKKMNEENNKEN